MLSILQCLRDVANWCKSIKTKTTNIGSFTTTTAPTKQIPVSTITTVISKQLPPGTYVISAALGWANANSSMITAEYITIGDDIKVAGATRGMVSGGPYSSITGCVELTETSTINIKQFWSGGSGTATNFAPVLYTLRIS